MALDRLLETLAAETEAAAARLLEEAREGARAVVDDAAEQAARQEAAALERDEAAWRAALEHDVAAARREGRLRWLRARETLLARVFARAVERLPAMAADPRYAGTIPAELERALPYLAGAPCVVHGPPAHLPVIRNLLGGRPEIRVEGDQADGLRITAVDGSVEVDRSLRRRLESLRLPLSVSLMKEVDRDHASSLG